MSSSITFARLLVTERKEFSEHDIQEVVKKLKNLLSGDLKIQIRQIPNAESADITLFRLELA